MQSAIHLRAFLRAQNNWECLSERDRVSDPRFNMRMASGHCQSWVDRRCKSPPRLSV